MRRLIEAIPEDAWTPIPYWLEGGADVAETRYTPFAQEQDAQPVRLIVRRVQLAMQQTEAATQSGDPMRVAKAELAQARAMRSNLLVVNKLLLAQRHQATASTARRYEEAAEQFMESLNELEIVCIGAQVAWRRRSIDNGAAASAAFEGLASQSSRVAMASSAYWSWFQEVSSAPVVTQAKARRKSGGLAPAAGVGIGLRGPSGGSEWDVAAEARTGGRASRDADGYVIVASKGGAPTHLAWHNNLLANPGRDGGGGRRVPTAPTVAIFRNLVQSRERRDERAPAHGCHGGQVEGAPACPRPARLGGAGQVSAQERGNHATAPSDSCP